MMMAARAEITENPAKTEHGKYRLYSTLIFFILYLADCVTAQAPDILFDISRGERSHYHISNADYKFVYFDPPKAGDLKEALFWSVRDSCLSVCLRLTPLLLSCNFRFQNHPT